MPLLMEENLRKLVQGGCVITSCFSGSGTFETAVRLYLAEVADQLVVPATCRGKITFYAATDVGKLQRTFLAQRVDRPAHLFSDVLDRLHDVERETLLALQTQRLVVHTPLYAC